jgi:hypothetical protein
MTDDLPIGTQRTIYVDNDAALEFATHWFKKGWRHSWQFHQPSGKWAMTVAVSIDPAKDIPDGLRKRMTTIS